MHRSRDKPLGAALAGHPELASVRLRASAAIGCLVIAKVLIEAEAAQQHRNLPALRQRVLRALLGYLLWPAAKDAMRKNQTAASDSRRR